MKPLTKREILKRHKQNPKDKELYKTIETKEIKKSDFNKLIQQSTKQEPFDKKIELIDIKILVKKKGLA